MRALAAATLLATLAIGHSALAADTQTPQENTRPEWCRVGYVCIPTAAAADLSAKLINLEAENQSLKVTKKHIVGWAAVCGPSASVQVQAGKWDLAGTISCTIGPGIRW